jgi:MFS transporter, putative metabolite:H+ symporter
MRQLYFAPGGDMAEIDTRAINARMERLPYCSWHTRMRLIICTAWFFDAFDSLAIAYVLPVLIGAWKLAPGQIGTLIAAGFAGQLVGSIAAGWAAERWGRVATMITTLAVFTVMSFVCALAWSTESLLGFRFIQGIGLGGEIPIMAAYVNEFARAERRGRFSLGIQVLFAVGLLVVALVGAWVVPHLGWQWMFIIGAVPALLAWPMRFMLPESPRWLASRGRFAEADAALGRIEAIAQAEGKPLPPIAANLPPVVEASTRLADLFRGIYLKRTLTLWALWVCSYLIIYGLTTWAPSLFRTAYKLPLQQSLVYGLILSVVGLAGVVLCVLLIDRVGRRRVFGAGFLLASLPLLTFAAGGQRSAAEVLAFICAGFFFISFLAIGLATYTAENYPNQLRALGGGIAAAWQRGASMVGPFVVGLILPTQGPNAVFVMFGVVSLIGAVFCFAFAVETRGRVLEELAPANPS